MSVIEKIFECFHEKNIEYCHWKSTNHLKETYQAITDIDILVSKNMVSDCENIFSQFKVTELQTVYLRSYPGIHDYLLFDQELGWVHFHLHFQLNLGDRWSKNYHFPYERSILINRVYDKNFKTYTINPLDEIYLFLMRMILKYNNPMRSRQIRDELEFLLDRVNVMNESTLSIDNTAFCFDKINLNGLDECIKSFNKIRKNIKATAIKKYRRYSYFRYYANVLTRMIYRYYIEFLRRILKHFSIGRRRLRSGGKIVVFLGTDGSGKSTNSNIAKIKFSKQINTTEVFLGSGESGANILRKIIFKIYGKRRYTSNLHKTEAGDSKGNLFYFWHYLTLVNKFSELKKMIVAKGNSNLILVDRWPTGTQGLTDGLRLDNLKPKNKFQKYIINSEKKFSREVKSITPDLVLKLDVSPDTALSRKPGEFTKEYSMRTNNEILARKTEAIKEVVIDANQDLHQVSKEVNRVIWDVISQ
jgi:thymidylate kinase